MNKVLYGSGVTSMFLQPSWFERYETKEQLVADFPNLGFVGEGWYNSPSGQTALVVEMEGGKEWQFLVWDVIDPREVMNRLRLLPEYDSPDGI